jgi:hypothetical protein
MKNLIVTVVLLTTIATPAFAQSFDPTIGTGNVLQFEYQTRFNKGAAMVYAPASSSAYAQATDVASRKVTGVVSGHLGYHGI